ncbi:MAG: hypothetical protein DMG30_25960 [Acidobacteria bacterium]|nr:MAG: hypothetical protein DMG30_25960 [Acidobacteriota bacterium]PYY03197.1 MAG: hypothetical protein DMG69_32960 [Acidobacteriota bacterium]
MFSPTFRFACAFELILAAPLLGTQAARFESIEYLLEGQQEAPELQSFVPIRDFITKFSTGVPLEACSGSR